LVGAALFGPEREHQHAGGHPIQAVQRAQVRQVQFAAQPDQRRLHDVEPARHGRQKMRLVDHKQIAVPVEDLDVERDRAVDFVTSLLPRPRRKKVRDTWDLIDLKLGAFVRGQALLIVLVGTVLSGAFWAIGLPYFILIGAFAGLVEIVPVIGPIAAGTLAVAVGATESWHMALAAGICVLGVRLLEDYLIVPKVLGEAVGLSPLLVLVSVTAVGILFGGFAVILAVPLAAVLVTLLDVIVRDVDPSEEDVPTVLFPAKDAEA